VSCDEWKAHVERMVERMVERIVERIVERMAYGSWFLIAALPARVVTLAGRLHRPHTCPQSSPQPNPQAYMACRNGLKVRDAGKRLQMLGLDDRVVVFIPVRRLPLTCVFRCSL